MNVKVQITRPIFIDGETKQIGDTVEVEKNFALELISVNAAEYPKEAEVKSDDSFSLLKTKANSLGVKFTKKTTVEELTALVAKEESIAFDALKAKAYELKIEYGENVTAEELTKLIEEAESK